MKETVENYFHEEFQQLADKFKVLVLQLFRDGIKKEISELSKEALPSKEENLIWYPGVYVFIGGDSVYKVGCSMNNSRKRALEHFTDNTQKNCIPIHDIYQHPDASILLFNIKNPQEDSHWILALEAFLEKKLDPKIRSGRIG